MAGNMSGPQLLTLHNVSWNSRTNGTCCLGDMAHLGSLTILNVTGETMDDDSGREFYLLAQLVTGLFFYPIVCLFGLTGNILSIIVLSGRQMATSTNSFLVGLAVADTIKLINDVIYSVVTLVIYLNPPAGHRALGYMYPYAHYLFNASVCITAWLSVAVAAERYMLVCHATRARMLWNISRARTTVVVVFVSMSLLTLPFALRYRTVHYRDDTNATSVGVDVTELWRVRSFVVAYTWSQNCMRSLVPIAILCALSYFIVRSLRRTQQSTKRRLSSRRRITVMLVSVIVVFVLCVTPDAVISTVYGFGYYEANYVVRGVREITDLLLTVNSAVNFILYCTFNSIFRKNFLALFCRQMARQRTSLSGPLLKLSFGNFRQSTLPNGLNKDT